MKKQKLFTKLVALLSIFFFCSQILIGQKIAYNDNWGEQGLTIETQKTNSLSLNYSIEEFSITEQQVKGEIMKNISLPGVLLPNDAGMPDLPGEGYMLAIPQGAKVNVEILDYKLETIENISIAPAMEIPLETDDKPIKYEKNNEVYQLDQDYPKNPVNISEKTKLRGLDIVTLGITPFQYNPVQKTLKIYRDMKIAVTFEGGNGIYGDQRYRSRFWEPVLQSNLINYDALPAFEYSKTEKNSRSNEFEYVIITLDDPDFLAWADSLAEFRRKQGISTGVITIDTIGSNTVAAIEGWIDNVYNNWSVPPAAILLLGDYSTGTNGIISHIYDHPSYYPDFASDNKYADVDGDELPDIALARITANNAAQLEVMITKVLDYERNPPTSPNFYNNPITALGWQTERWFQICSETIGGYWSNELGKTPDRINAVYGGNPNSDPWSTATNTATVLDYFGPNGLGYIPASPSQLGGWSGGTGQDVENAINSGAFMLQHRDHGSYTGWGEPDFGMTNIGNLQNTNNELSFILSINCQTGAFHNASESFAEKFHRHTYNGQNSGALGIIAATEVSYSFVNDTYVWGAFDNMWPDFLPDYSANFPANFIYPCFANAAGKHFLYQSSWPYNTSSKQVTYRLFHHHGDAFLNVYSEIPQNLTVTCPNTHVFGQPSMDVNVDSGAVIAVTHYNSTLQKSEIIGEAISSNGPTTITLTNVPTPGSNMLVTITKQNYYRYSQEVMVIAPSGPYVIVDDFLINDGNNNHADFGETFDMDITVKNVGVATANNVEVTLSTTNTNVISLTNATNISYGNLSPDATATSSSSFTVELADDIEDQSVINFEVDITDNSKALYESNINISVNAPSLSIGEIIIDDSGTGNNDGILDPGETANIIIQASNIGHADVSNAIGTLSSASGHLTMNTTTTTPTSLNIGNAVDFSFSVTADGATPIGTPADLTFTLTAGNNDQYTASEIKQIIIGEIPEYLMADGTATTCVGNFYDSGGPNNDFGNNESFTFTFHPAIAGNMIESTFTFFDCGNQGSGWDYLEIYDGENTSADLIISSDVAGAAAMLSTFTATNPQGALTFYFHSTGVVPNPGWEAEISCYSAGPAPGTASANPENICQSGTTELTLNQWHGDNMKWQSSPDGSTWTDISGANTTPYTTSVLTETTHFRAQVNKAGYDSVYSDPIIVNIHDMPVAGSASVNNSSICENDIVELTLSGHTGTIQWQESEDGSTWTDIIGANTTPFTTNSLSSNYYFRASVSNAACDPVFSDEVFVTVNAAPIALFSCDTISEPIILFSNESLNAESYSWDFGDGIGSSTDTNPTYTYTENGVYTVTLSASNSHCADHEYSNEVIIESVGIDELSAFGISVYPNPTNGMFFIEIENSPNDMLFVISDINGKEIIRKKGSEKLSFNLANYDKGIYILKIETENKTVVKQIILR